MSGTWRFSTPDETGVMLSGGVTLGTVESALRQVEQSTRPAVIGSGDAWGGLVAQLGQIGAGRRRGRARGLERGISADGAVAQFVLKASPSTSPSARKIKRKQHRQPT